MRHQKNRLRLPGKPDHGRMIERNMVTSLLLYERIRTTRKRARVIQPIVDKLISNAKRQEKHVAIRTLNAFVTDKNASRKMMDVLKERYGKRASGFTSMKAVGARKGDGAELVDLSLVDAVLGSQDKKEEGKAEKKLAKKTSKKAAK